MNTKLIVMQQIAGIVLLVVGMITSKDAMVAGGVIIVVMCGLTQIIIEEIHKAKK